MMYENRTKVIKHLIDNPTKYKWIFDIHTNSFEMFVDNTQFILKNTGETALYEYYIVFVVKNKRRNFLVRSDDEPLLRDLWVKLYSTYVSTMYDYGWDKVCDVLNLDCNENEC